MTAQRQIQLTDAGGVELTGKLTERDWQNVPGGSEAEQLGEKTENSML